MAKAIYNGVANVARKVKESYAGVNNVSRKVKRGYIGVDNVARHCYSARSVWNKYSCDYYREYYEREETNEPETMYNHTYGCGFPMNVTREYTFHSYTGYAVRLSSVTIPNPPTLEDIAEAFVGTYYVNSWSSEQFVYRIDSITSFEAPNANGYGYFRCEGTVIERCWFVPAQYYKGSISYGNVIVEEDDLPEEGTLVEGSIDEGYCVLQVGSTYYYYILED